MSEHAQRDERIVQRVIRAVALEKCSHTFFGQPCFYCITEATKYLAPMVALLGEARTSAAIERRLKDCATELAISLDQRLTTLLRAQSVLTDASQGVLSLFSCTAETADDAGNLQSLWQLREDDGDEVGRRFNALRDALRAVNSGTR